MQSVLKDWSRWGEGYAKEKTNTDRFATINYYFIHSPEDEAICPRFTGRWVALDLLNALAPAF